MLCEYGCGRQAKHYFPTVKKWCCSKHFSKCPKRIEKFSGDKNPMYKKPAWNKGKTGIYSDEIIEKMKCSRKTKGKTYEEIYGEEKAKELRKSRSEHFKKIKTGSVPWNKGKNEVYSNDTKKKMRHSALLSEEDYKKKYPLFIKIENPQFINKTIFVKCKYCSRKFTPNRIQLTERLRSLKTGKSNGYFYCSDKCKNECNYFGRQVDPQHIDRFREYVFKVYKETRETLKQHNIKNIELRGMEKGYELDHKFSIYDGFVNQIPHKLIAHHKNLQVIPTHQNRSKGSSSSISLKELLSFIK
jgi:hypothetical protein